MQIDFATSGVSGRDKMDAWRAALATVFGPFEVNASENFSGRVRCSRRGQLQFNEIYYRWQTGERTPGNIARLQEESYILTRPVEGPLRVEGNGRDVVLSPGFLYLFNQSLPFRFTSETGYHAFSVSLPACALRLREPKIGPIYKIALADGSPRGQLLTHYIDYLAAGIHHWSDNEAAGLSERLFDLIVLLMVQQDRGKTSEHDSAIKAAHRERAIAYIQSHLSDIALTPEKIAHRCGISISYLHQVFAAAALTVEDFVYIQRVERCRELLLDPSHRQKSISQIAYQVGFRHPSHFTRLFKQRFGQPPKEYRAAHAGPTHGGGSAAGPARRPAF